MLALAFSAKYSLAELLVWLSTLPPNCDFFTSLSHWGILLRYFLEPPASIVMYTVKYASCDLIPYIPVQIRAVSVQDYPGNSCNAASPQLISLRMSEESWVTHQRELPKLQCIIPSQLSTSSDLVWYAKDTARVFCLNGLSCIYYGHTAPVIEVWSRLSGERRAAECKWRTCNHQAIIMQSEFQSSLSSGFCLKVTMLQRGEKSGGYNQNKATVKRGRVKKRRESSRNSLFDSKLSLLVKRLRWI